MDYFIEALKKYADFTGRARRKEYWMFTAFYMVFYIACIVIDAAIGMVVLSTIFSLALLVPTISIGARRLHDTGRSGWWQLIVLIPLVGLIIILVFLTQDSHDTNNYGVNPKVDAAA